MKRILLAWLFFIIICFKALPCSACESAFTPKAGASKPLAQEEKQLRNVYNRIIESRKKKDCRAYEEVVHHVLHLRTLKRAKGVYGGGDLLRPRSHRSGASSLLLKPSSLLPTVLKHLAVELLLFVIFP